MAWGIKGEAFKKKIKVTLYFEDWIREKLLHVGNQSTFVRDCILKCNPDWKEEKDKKKKGKK